MRDIQRRIAAACCIVLALTLPGCDDDEPSAPAGQEGFVGAVVTDDPTAPAPGAGGPQVASGASNAALYSGSISGDVAVAISANGTTWIELGPIETVSLAAQSATTVAVHADAAVPASSYDRVRVRLRDATVEVLAGSTVGGITLVTDVQVVIGSGDEIEIVMTVPAFQVTADASVLTQVTLDLNSELWITEDAVQTGAASESDVEAAVEGEVRAVARSQ